MQRLRVQGRGQPVSSQIIHRILQQNVLHGCCLKDDAPESPQTSLLKKSRLLEPCPVVGFDQNINLFGSDGVKHVGSNQSRNTKKCVLHTVKHGGVSVMVAQVLPRSYSSLREPCEVKQATIPSLLKLGGETPRSTELRQCRKKWWPQKTLPLWAQLTD